MLNHTRTNDTWIELLNSIMQHGRQVAPRGKLTKELPQRTIKIDMRRPVMTILERKLSYKFMFAEAHWMLTADDTVAGIAPFNENIAAFSDDGRTFFGAYGPRINQQIEHVVQSLRKDPDTRQAGLTTWRPNPPESKDIPCTIAMWFMQRGINLNCHVFMRSSDAWLGIPYDIFNFSMVTHLVCAKLNHHRRCESIATDKPIDMVTPGDLHVTAASSHLYEPNWAGARTLINRYDEGLDTIIHRSDIERSPWQWAVDQTTLIAGLKASRDLNLRWWLDGDTSAPPKVPS